ncbi:hypothetical protein GCM10027290_42470 [Micromonospora sonneratiae]|uniref:DUF397 domain-containing protein n=1 Tax=Micromonospora sonneratiae TaxID=1184706 RepID=A0ABW3YBS4_9ACTN
MADRTGQWCRSSRCESHNCVEVALAPDRVCVRDSQANTAGGLEFGDDAWRAFCAALRAGRLTGR